MLKKLILFSLLSILVYSQVNTTELINPNFKIGLKLGASYNNIISTNCLGGLLGLTYKKTLSKNVIISPELYIRYQSFNDNTEYPQFNGTLEWDEKNGMQVIGAHEAYSLKSQGSSAILEAAIKISFIQDEKIHINMIPYYTLFLFGQEWSETTSPEPINGIYSIIQPTEWSETSPKNSHGFGSYIGISYQFNPRTLIEIRTPILMSNYFDGNNITSLYYVDKIGNFIILSFNYYLH